MTVRRLFVSLALVLVLATAFVAGRATAAQPHMVAALDHLKAAKAELEVAERDKAGHREKALGFVNGAIDQVNKGIAAGAGH